MKFFDYTKLSFSALVKKIGNSRYFDLPAMLEEALNKLSGRVETLEDTQEELNIILGKSWKAKVKKGEFLESGVLEAGKAYVINSLEAGDDFSNVGYVSENVEFIATGTTPTSWANFTIVFESNGIVTEVSNTMGGAVRYVYIDGNTRHIIIDTNSFVDINKIILYPIAVNSAVSIVDSNTLQVTNLADNLELLLILEVYE